MQAVCEVSMRIGFGSILQCECVFEGHPCNQIDSDIVFFSPLFWGGGRAGGVVSRFYRIHSSSGPPCIRSY